MHFSIWVDSIRRKLTPWFAGAERPARAGVYQRSFPAGPYSGWSGSQWLEDAPSVAMAAVQTSPSRYQKASWRGLVQASEPLEGLGPSTGTDSVNTLVDVAAEQGS